MRYSWFILLILILSCTREAVFQSKPFPYFITNEVTEIDPTGATLSATVINAGKDEVVDLGFIYWDNQVKYEISILKKGGSLQHFTTRITSDLNGGLAYTCQAYVRTTKDLILGNLVKFTSQGTPPPVIESLIPNEGYDGINVILNGRNFSKIQSFNEVLVNGVKAYLLSSQDNRLEFILPHINVVGKANVVVLIKSQVSSSPAPFTYFGPEIQSFSKLTGKPGESILIKGKNFVLGNVVPAVYLNQHPTRVTRYSDSEVEFILPTLNGPESVGDFKLLPTLVCGSKTVIGQDSITIHGLWEAKTGFSSNQKGRYTSFTYDRWGYLYGIDSKELLEYDAALDRWDVITKFPSRVCENSTFLVAGDYLYKIGCDSLFDPDQPNGPRQLTGELWKFHFKSRTWNKMNPVPFSFYHAKAFLVKDVKYVITEAGEIWKCDFEKESYTQQGRFPGNGLKAQQFSTGGKTLFVTERTTIEFIEHNETWIPFNSNPFSSQIIGFALNGTGYVLEYGYRLFKYNTHTLTWDLTSQFPGCTWSGPNELMEIFTLGNQAYFITTQSNTDVCAPSLFVYKE